MTIYLILKIFLAVLAGALVYLLLVRVIWKPFLHLLAGIFYIFYHLDVAEFEYGTDGARNDWRSHKWIRILSPLFCALLIVADIVLGIAALFRLTWQFSKK